MAHFAVLLSLLILLDFCLGQERGGTDPRVALPLLKQVLDKAKVSASLEYWGRCESYTDFPVLTYPSTFSGPATGVLREAFANDPRMQVTQEPDGLIRMVETDVPTDLLDISIGRVSFQSSGRHPDTLGGPNNAMFLVLSAPEVKAYRKAHNIGPFVDGRILPGDSASKQRVSGDLYNVTVREALDYILKFYPGFWIYENCQSSDTESGRNVFLAFFMTDRPSADSTKRVP